MVQYNYIELFEKFLRKETTDEEVQALIEWLKGEAYTDWSENQWELVSGEMNPELQQQLLARIKKNIQPASPHEKSVFQERISATLFRWVGRVAVVIAFAILSGLGVYYLNSPEMEDMTLSVERGQKATITLPDGSKVWINSDSHLAYGHRFNRKERVLYLEGEAYFEVAPDPNRPFIVETETMAVQALGTSFNIKSYKDERFVSVVLMTGKVKVDSFENSYILLPNERYTYNRNTGESRTDRIHDSSLYASWRNNYFMFDGETLENIAFTLERNYNTTITFESETLKRYSFTGSLNNTSLESILQILSLTSPLSYEIKGNTIIFKENSKQIQWYEEAIKK